MTDSKYFTTTKKGTVLFHCGVLAYVFPALPSACSWGGEGRRPGAWKESWVLPRASLTQWLQKTELLVV